jgi:hypothetical protein
MYDRYRGQCDRGERVGPLTQSRLTGGKGHTSPTWMTQGLSLHVKT